MNNIKLTNKNLLLWCSGLSITINLFKAVVVFQKVSFTDTSISSFVYSTISMLIVEFSIIIFLANGKGKDSVGFGFLSVVINLYYFNQLQFHDFRLNLIHVIFAFVLPYISARMSHIYIQINEKENEDHNQQFEQLKEQNFEYSNKLKLQENNLSEYSNRIKKMEHEIHEQQKENQDLLKEKEDNILRIETLQKYEDQQRLKNRNNLKEIEKLKNLNRKYKKGFDNFEKASICPHCKERYEPSGLNRHISMCSMNPKNKRKNKDPDQEVKNKQLKIEVEQSNNQNNER